MQGHTFKYKDKDGNWIEIPILVESMYNAYVAYCTKKNIDPVSEDTYYQSVGDLQNLVNKLDGSADQVAALISALGDGVLPQRLGGLGVAIGSDAYPTLQDALVKLANMVTLEQFTANNATLANSIADVDTELRGLLTDKKDASAFSYGTKTPDKNTSGEYYFQHS